MVQSQSDPPPLSGTAIHAETLTKSYGSAAAPVLALRGVTFRIECGERVALLGKSGSGKSTLLNLMGGLDHATSGNLSVGGNDLCRLKGSSLARFRSTTVGMIFQSFNLIPSRTAFENVELPMLFSGYAPRQRRLDAERALAAVGLASRMRHRPAELSGGENQRVAVARSLVNRPAIILADEPTGNLDSATARDVMNLILTHVHEYGATLVLVTHDEELAELYTNRVIRMKDGQIVPNE